MTQLEGVGLGGTVLVDIRTEGFQAEGPVLLENSDTLGVDRQETAVLPSLGHIGLSCLLQSKKCGRGELGILVIQRGTWSTGAVGSGV